VSSINNAQINAADDTTKLFYNIIIGKANLPDNPDISIASLTKAIQLYEKLQFKYPQYIELLHYRAFASDLTNDRITAEQWYRRTLLKGYVVEHDIDVDNNCYLNLGNIYNERGDYELALEAYHKIQWKDSTMQVEIHGDYYGKMLNKYVTLGSEKKWHDALVLNDSLINYTKTKYGITHNYYLTALTNKGVICNSLHDWAAAREVYKLILDIGKEYYLIDHSIAYAYIRYIELSCNMHLLGDAMAIFPEAVRYLNDHYDPSNPAYALSFYVGMEMVNQGECEAGIVMLENYLANATSIDDKWSIPYAINSLSFAYVILNNPEKCIAILKPILDADNTGDNLFPIAVIGMYCQTIGFAYYQLSEFDRAMHFFEQSEQIKSTIGEASDQHNIDFIQLCKSKL
jgi:tetratricopeptide (TPR) repeat protein